MRSHIALLIPTDSDLLRGIRDPFKQERVDMRLSINLILSTYSSTLRKHTPHLRVYCERKGPLQFDHRLHISKVRVYCESKGPFRICP